MAIEDSQREFTERRPPLKSAVDAGDPPVRIGTPELDGQPNPFQSWTPPSEPDLVRR